MIRTFFQIRFYLHIMKGVAILLCKGKTEKMSRTTFLKKEQKEAE
jgi:hypothetical protein